MKFPCAYRAWHITPVFALLGLLFTLGCEPEADVELQVGADEAAAEELPTYISHIDEHVEGFEMVKVPAGTVQVPNPDDPDELIEVEVGPFWMATAPVTWDAFYVWAMKEDEAYDPVADALTRPTVATEDFSLDRGYGWGQRPAVGMTEQSAAYFARWYSEQAGATYRLPTEAEWIHACQAGTICEPMDEEELARIAWFAGNTAHSTEPVGQLEPNAWGLYDMLGNVAEWVQGIDGQYVVMGGSFRDAAEDICCTYRQPEDPTWQGMVMPESPWWFARAGFTGLRLVREVDDAQP